MITNPFKRTLLTASSGLVLAAAGAQAASAQEDAPQARSVETIVVTAQKREQGVQDVPISIGAYDQDVIQNAGVRDIKDLISIAPGLIVTSTQSETITTARIRGIGTVGDNFGLESSVGVTIDGVFRARNGVSFGDLGEIERIEVLRGPQGTLFGRNTSAGVLNVITAQPEFEFKTRGEVTVGNFNQLRVAGSVTGPLVEDVLAFRLFGVYGERDGFQDLIVENQGNEFRTDSENQDYYSLRGQFLYTPTDDFTLRVIGDYTERDEVCCSAPQFDHTATAAGLITALTADQENSGLLFPADPEERLSFSNVIPVQIVEDWGLSAEATWDVGPGQLTSVSAFRNFDNERGQDVDYTTADIAFRSPDVNFTNIDRFTQELRYAGVWNKLDWLVGGFFSREDLELGDGIQYGDDFEVAAGLLLNGTPTGAVDTISALTGGAVNVPFGAAFPDGSGAGQDFHEQTATSFAAFTHNTYNVTDALAITAGLRFTYERKELESEFATDAFPGANTGCDVLEQAFGPDPITGAIIAGVPADTAIGAIGLLCLPFARSGLDATGYDEDRTDEEFSGTFKVSYRFTDDLLGYVGYSRGFKAGGFNLDRDFDGDPVDTNDDGVADAIDNVNTEFDPELVDAFEVGVKSELLNNTLLLNGAYFYQDITDFQLNTFTGLGFVVDSVDQVISQGVEIDALYLPPVDGLTLQGGFAYIDAVYEDVNTGTPLIDAIEGENLSLSPEFFVNGAVTYRRPIVANLEGLFSLDGRWVSSYNTGSDLDPEKEQEAFGLINGRIGIGRQDRLWQIELFGRNLTDETYAQVVFDAFGQGAREGQGTRLDPRGSASYSAFLAAPRTWGVTLRTEF